MSFIGNSISILVAVYLFGNLNSLSKGINQVEAAITDLASNLSCSVFHGTDERVFTWSTIRVYDIDVVLYESTRKTYINCLLQTNDINEVPSDLKMILKLSNNESQAATQTFFSSISNNSGEISISFEEQYLEMKLDTYLPFQLNISSSNSTQLILKGAIVRIGSLPSFSKIFLNNTFLESVNNSKSGWKFYSQSCNRNLVIIVPGDISEFKNGFPLGVAFASNQMTLLRGENVTIEDVPGLLEWNMEIAISGNFLILYNASQLYVSSSISDDTFQGSRLIAFKQDVSSILQISEILSISLSSKCGVGNNVSWFDLVILVRLTNASVRAVFSTQPYRTWSVYHLPGWIFSADNITAQIDVDRRSLFLVANIGKPLKSIVMVYDVKSDTDELMMTSTPFILNHALQNPQLKMLAEIPAILLYDKTELWLSTDAGHNFRLIFVAQIDDEILQVETATATGKELIIITTKSIFDYSSSGLRKSLTDSSINCLMTKQTLVVATANEIVNVFCNDVFSSEAKLPMNLNFDSGMLLIPSVTTKMINDFEINISLPIVYQDVQAMKQNLKYLCLIPMYPNMHLCGAKMQQGNSLTVYSKQWVQLFANCSFEFTRANNSFYAIHAASTPSDGSCDLWSANMIGQTLIILKTQTTCWVQWLLNHTTALADCSKHHLIGYKQTFKSPNIALIDSRGNERCQKCNVTLHLTNSSEIFEINLAILCKEPSYLRIDNAVGSLSHGKNKTFFTLLGKAKLHVFSFDYICCITKLAEDDGDAKVLELNTAAKTCHFDIGYQGLSATNIYLDANEEKEFNVTLTKMIDESPYLEEIPPLAIQPIERTHVKFQIKSFMQVKPMTVRVLLKQKPNSHGTSLLSIYSTVQPTHCNGSQKQIIVHGTCPPGKHLTFDHPLHFDRDTWLYGDPTDHDDFTKIATIPYNYQPPSRLGKAIPLTPNIYNADPSRPMHRASYKVSRDIARFKQCQGKFSRSHCGCTLDMTISALPKHTDCIQRAYKVYFMKKFLPKLFIVDGDGKKTSLEFPYCITEINDRKDYTIENKVRSGCMSSKRNSSLKFDGSGLFHFRVDVTKTGYTFCDLHSFFILFVAEAPMPYPAEELVRAMTSFCFGSIILCVFLLNYHLK